MLNLRVLDEAQITDLYEQKMRSDFPPSELKYLSSILNMVRMGVYDVLGAYDGEGRFAAYALVYRPREGRIALIDYLAVEQGMRGNGIGSALISRLRGYYAEEMDALMIECERPKSAPDEVEARRRISFYTRSGAVLTPVRIWLFGVEYSILYLPCVKNLEKHDWAQQMLTLYRQMLPAELYERNVRLLRG